MQVAGRLELVRQAPISRRRLRCHLKRRNALSNDLKSKLHRVAGGFFLLLQQNALKWHSEMFLIC